ncbi:translation initiation factor IF-2 [Candidatus Woesearchaeota archaeon]|nr:translation initiation factor IF-2 [Candidatus Woesearchaeota archaeon]
MIRQPLVAVLGHVDHGKTLLLDHIRTSSMVSREAGGITQSIGASYIPLEIIKQNCGDLLKKFDMQFTIPGLLFIDTPGHAAFVSLRKRGGNIADIGILVVDINEGFKPQTLEAIEILRSFKTPFIIAANKIDLMPGWKSGTGSLLGIIQQQSPQMQSFIEQKLYELVGQLYEKHQIQAERFDRIQDFTKQIVIVPVSAKTGEGIPELLMMLTGLAQKFLEQNLKYDPNGPAKGSILEIKEDKGIGKTMDVILYDGTLTVGDQLVIAALPQPITTKIKALFQPMPLAEMRDKKTKYQSVKEVQAACGVKIAAPEIEGAIAGMPIMSVKGSTSIEEACKMVMEDVSDVLLHTEKEGIFIKADTIGSLEALSHLLKERQIPVRQATIGEISKKDITEAQNAEDPLHRVVLGFNVMVAKDVEIPSGIKVQVHEIIYRLIEEFEQWKLERLKALEQGELTGLMKPVKLKLMHGYVFRQSGPAVVGTEVLEGEALPNLQLMNQEGKDLTVLKSIQVEKENVSSLSSGKQAAMAFENVTMGRQLKEGDVLYSSIPEPDFRKLKTLKKLLTQGEWELLREIADIKRKQNPVWGM